jgi:amino acid permease
MVGDVVAVGLDRLCLVFIFVFIGLRTVGGNALNSNQQIWLAIVAAMMFESLLERQAGVLITILALQVMLDTKNTNNSQIKDENTLNI